MRPSATSSTGPPLLGIVPKRGRWRCFWSATSTCSVRCCSRRVSWRSAVCPPGKHTTFGRLSWPLDACLAPTLPGCKRCRDRRVSDGCLEAELGIPSTLRPRCWNPGTIAPTQICDLGGVVLSPNGPASSRIPGSGCAEPCKSIDYLEEIAMCPGAQRGRQEIWQSAAGKRDQQGGCIPR